MNNLDYTVKLITHDAVMNYQFENSSTDRVATFVKMHIDKCHTVIIQKVDKQREYKLGESPRK